MRLAKLTLQGFKSFADKTEFTFDRAITGVVGPNGCGKSNVVDAIKWVLGERSSKALRGTEMLDVIFAGSAGRKPLGMASVTLTFENPVESGAAVSAVTAAEQSEQRKTESENQGAEAAPAAEAPAVVAVAVEDEDVGINMAVRGKRAADRYRHRRGRAPALPRRHQRVLDQQQEGAPQGHPRPLPRYRHRRRRLLDHRAGQGRRDAPGVAEERRAVFEEAAGVAKYKPAPCRGRAQARPHRDEPRARASSSTAPSGGCGSSRVRPPRRSSSRSSTASCGR